MTDGFMTDAERLRVMALLNSAAASLGSSHPYTAIRAAQEGTALLQKWVDADSDHRIREDEAQRVETNRLTREARGVPAGALECHECGVQMGADSDNPQIAYAMVEAVGGYVCDRCTVPQDRVEESDADIAFAALMDSTDKLDRIAAALHQEGAIVVARRITEVEANVRAANTDLQIMAGRINPDE